MKSWRTWLLLLLAVLLPVRAAVAAAMLCPVAGPGAQVELAMLGHPAGAAAIDDTPSQHTASHHHPGSHDPASGHGQAAEDAPADGPPGHDPAATEACNACAAYCSLTPFLGSPPTLAEPREPTAVRFSDLAAPPPSFVSGGQDRPPRTV